MPMAPLRRCVYAKAGRRCGERQDGPYCARHFNVSARNHWGVPRQARGLGADHDRARRAVQGQRCALRLPGCTGIATSPNHRIPRSLGGTPDPSNIEPACAHCQNVQGAQLATRAR